MEPEARSGGEGTLQGYRDYFRIADHPDVDAENVTPAGFRWITWARLLTVVVSSVTSWNVLVAG